MDDLKPSQLAFDALIANSQLESVENEETLVVTETISPSLESYSKNNEVVAGKITPKAVKTADNQQDQLAPMMRNYLELKKRYPEHILLFQVGDFYEIFFEDARIVSETLGIRLTSRSKEQPNPIPMCGVPIHAIDNYIPRLLQEGLSCVVVSQVDEEAKGKGMVRREISRIVTPGIRYEGDGLDERAYNYLGAAVLNPRGAGSLVYVDVSTGHLHVEEVESPEELIENVQRIVPSELIMPSAVYGVKVERGNSWAKDLKAAAKDINCHIVQRPFEKADKTFLLDRVNSMLPPRVGLSKEQQSRFLVLTSETHAAINTILNYVDEVSFGHTPRISSFQIDERQRIVFIDNATRRNLELLQTRIDGEKKHSLIQHLDHSVTPMGARLFKEWILSPSSNITEIVARQDTLAAMLQSNDNILSLRKTFAAIRDLDRLVSRISSGRGSPRDLANLRDSIVVLPDIHRQLLDIDTPLAKELVNSFDLMNDLLEKLEGALVDEPPTKINEGGIFKSGYHVEIDKLRTIRANGKSFLSDMEEQEKQRTGITGLKIKYNNVFGYFIEITKANLKKVPANYERRQTLVNAERFITPELKSFESTILSAKAKQIDLERQLFIELRDQIASQAGRIQTVSGIVAVVDVLQAFAYLAQQSTYCRPEITTEGVTLIKDGRHPVVERVIGQHNFIANDSELDCASRRFAVLTGPNMGGKSTYLRQVGLIQILAQAGSYVPAQSAKIGLVDRIFTRIGSSDDISRGDSTFMVEMREASTIVRKATSRSLVLIDEIGRGTATTDGLAIATAIAEWLHDKVGCRTLFATHFHELTALSNLKEGVFCLAVGVVEKGKDIFFTHRIDSGAADRSYGIEVARLAGLPEKLLARAQQFLGSPIIDSPAVDMQNIEVVAEPENDASSQRYEEVAERLKNITPEEMKPIEALMELSHLKEIINSCE